METLEVNISLQDGECNVTNGTDCGFFDEEASGNIFVIIILITLFIIVFFLGLGGNCLVCFVVWRNPRMRSATNIFLVNLAVADFMVILICLPPTAVEDSFGFWYLGLEMCKIVKYVQKVSVFVSVLTLTAISIERWMAICRPLMFRQTSVRARRTIAIVWLISLASATPDLVIMDLHSVRPGLAMCIPSWPDEVEKIHLLLIFVLFYVIPLVIMTFTYVRVAMVLWRSGSVDENNEAAASVPRAQMDLRKKKAKMLIVVVLIFAVCYFPIYVLFIFRFTGLLGDIPLKYMQPLAMIVHWLCYFNSSVNPAIYNFMSCKFRCEFRVACYICCRHGDKRGITMYEAMRLRNMHYAGRSTPRSSHLPAHGTDTSGLTRTESTFLATPILNGRRDQGDRLAEAAPQRSISPESTRRTRLSATLNQQVQIELYTAMMDPKMKAIMAML